MVFCWYKLGAEDWTCLDLGSHEQPKADLLTVLLSWLGLLSVKVPKGELSISRSFGQVSIGSTFGSLFQSTSPKTVDRRNPAPPSKPWNESIPL